MLRWLAVSLLAVPLPASILIEEQRWEMFARAEVVLDSGQMQIDEAYFAGNALEPLDWSEHIESQHMSEAFTRADIGVHSSWSDSLQVQADLSFRASPWGYGSGYYWHTMAFQVDQPGDYMLRLFHTGATGAGEFRWGDQSIWTIDDYVYQAVTLEPGVRYSASLWSDLTMNWRIGDRDAPASLSLIPIHTPEPGSGVLMVLSALCFAVARRKK
jgi:hypothetical protein